MGYFKVKDKISELQNLRDKGWVKGISTGWKNVDESFTLLKGYPLFFAGAPHSGKTEVVLEMLLNTSVHNGWKHFIYLGENGDVEEIIAEISFKYIGKQYKKQAYNPMDDSEKLQAEMFIDEHFVFLDDSEDLTLKEFYKLVEDAEDEYNVKFDTTLFDPFNDAVDESSDMGGTHHWLNRELKMVRRISKENKRIDILINHIADIKPTIDKDTGNAYLRPALPNEWNGGRTWWRRGFLMILVYIPPKWLNDENGIPYGENVSLLYVQKAKPKGIAKYGSVSKLYWNYKVNRYYWRDDSSIEKYSFMTNQEIEEPKETERIDAIEPNLDFNEEIKYF